MNRKRSFLTFFALIMAISSIFLSLNCNRTEDNVTTFKENPYEYVGRLHNEGLDYIEDVKQRNSRLNPRIVFDSLSSFYANRGLRSSIKYEMMVNLITDEQGEIITDGIQMFRNAKRKLTLTNLRSDNALQVVDDFLVQLSGTQNLQAAYQMIDNFEQNIYAQNYSDEDNAIILSATSTARSSLEYWSQNYDGFSQKEGVPEIRGCGFGCWLCVSLWDVGGAGLGAIAGPGGAVGLGASLSTLAKCCKGICSNSGCGWDCNF